MTLGVTIMTESIIYVTRHGETLLNTLDRMQGWCDSELTSTGEQQAIQSGKQLSKLSFDYVYSSDLHRAIQTRNLLLAQNQHSAHVVTPNRLFREVYFGYYEGLNATSIWASIAKPYGVTTQNELIQKLGFPAVRKLMHQQDPYNLAETYDQVMQRWQAGLDLIHKHTKDHAKILLVTHGTFIRTLADSQGIDTINNFPKNGGITILKQTDSRVQLIKYNQMKL